MAMLRQKVGPAVVVLSAVVAVGSRILDGADAAELGLPYWVWEALGATVFIAVVIALLYGHERAIEKRLATSEFVRPEDVPRIVVENIETGPSIPIEEAEQADEIPLTGLLDIRLAQGEGNWIHLEVRNSSATDEFVAKVIEVDPDRRTVPWSIKWRDVDTEERRILQGDVALLDLATFDLPVIKAVSELADDDEDGIPAILAAVTPGRYRLYSVSQPSGFDFSENQVGGLDELRFDPHHVKIRIAAVNQPTLYIETTLALSFQAYVREDGSPGCKPDIFVDENYYFGQL